MPPKNNGTPPRRALTYRSNASGTLRAAYLGRVRVGYVERRKYERWLWQAILLRPEGGAYHGVEDTEEEARESLEQSVHNWLVEAGITYN
jgi:hypothetical protein